MRVGLERLPVLFFEGALFSERVAEELSQVPGASVRLSPLELFGVPGRLLLLFGVLLLRRRFLAIGSLSLRCLLLDLFLFGLRHHRGFNVELSLFFLVAERDTTSDLADVALNAEELIHEAQLHALVLVRELFRVHEALKQDETLACAVLSNFLLNELHHQILIVQGGRVFLFLERVNTLGDWSELNRHLALGIGERASKLSSGKHLCFDELVDREVKQVVLDSQVGASGVDLDALLVVDEDDSGAETAAHIRSHALLRARSVDAEFLDAGHAIQPELAVRVCSDLSLLSFLFEHVDVLLSEVFTNLVLLFETVLDHLFVCDAGNHVRWSAQVGLQESSCLVDGFMVLAVDDVEELFTVVLVSSDDSENVFLDLSIGDATFERLAINFKSWADVLCNFGQIDDFAVGALRDDLSDERLSREGLAKHDGPLSSVAQVLIEGALVPASHGLESVVFLQKRVNRLDAEAVVNDVDLGHVVVATSSENDRSQLRTLPLELLSLLNRVREVREDELVALFNASVNDFL